MEVILLIEKKEYLDRLIQWKDEQGIKVVTGMNADCGFAEYMRDKGQLIYSAYPISSNTDSHKKTSA